MRTPHSQRTLQLGGCGSLAHMAWSSDGTVVAGAGGNGTVVFGELVERVASSALYRAEVTAPDLVSRVDYRKSPESRQWNKGKGFNKGTRVTQVSVGFGTLVVGVSTGPGMSELHLIDLEGDDSDDTHLYTRHTAAVRGNISLIVQGRRLIAVACAQNGTSLHIT